MVIKSFLTGVVPTVTYVFSDSGEAVIIDPAGRNADMEDYIEDLGVKVKHILITHAHADHFYGAPFYEQMYGCDVYIGEVDYPLLFDNMKNAASYLDLYDCEEPSEIVTLSDHEHFKVGKIDFEFLLTPGHTIGSGAYYVYGYVFDGDALFAGSVGRTDLYSGNKQALYDSIGNILYQLPEDTVVLSGHTGQTTIGKERKTNPFIRAKIND